LGDDYLGKSFTGSELKIDIHYLSRDHGWSTTKFKKLILKTFKTKK
jgi:DNA-binding response OmpR family regulator